MPQRPDSPISASPALAASTRRRLVLPLVLLLAACGNDPPSGQSGSAPATATSGSAATSTASSNATAPPSATAAKPKPTAYSGPTGFVTGIITASGDEPPTTDFKYQKGCEPAVATYGKLFRVGQDGTLADAIVSVTHYQGFVPPKSDKVELTIKTCAYNTRSVAMTDGQHLEVRNLDPLQGYIPHLDGARSPATIVAVPRGEPVKLYSRGRQRYWLRDQMGKPWMVAHVFHFPYSTTSVTGLDGRYRIEGVPVGPANVNVVLPLEEKGLKTMSKKIEIKEGENVLDLTMVFDLDKDLPSRIGNPAGSASPAASSSAAAGTPPSPSAAPAPPK